jgi:hypothetical protein
MATVCTIGHLHTVKSKREKIMERVSVTMCIRNENTGPRTTVTVPASCTTNSTRNKRSERYQQHRDIISTMGEAVGTSWVISSCGAWGFRQNSTSHPLGTSIGTSSPKFRSIASLVGITRMGKSCREATDESTEISERSEVKFCERECRGSRILRAIQSTISCSALVTKM